MMKSVVIIFLVIMSFSVVPIAGAQDDVLDNACLEGGSMAGTCTTEWHWNCGWYLARYERGEFTLLQMPTDCASSLIIPYLPPAKVAEFVNLVQTICHVFAARDKHCASSDQTGNTDFGNNGILDQLFVFVTNSGNCPAGYTPALGETTDPATWQSVGFTLQEINSLGLLPFFCFDSTP